MRKVLSFVVAISIVGLVSCKKSNENPDNANQTEFSQPVTSEVLLKTSVCWNGDSIPNYPEGIPECTILKITVAPHSKLDLHYHPMMNAGFIAEGELHVTDSKGREITLKAGEALAECVNLVHFGENLTDKPVVLYVFYAGVKGQELSIKE